MIGYFRADFALWSIILVILCLQQTNGALITNLPGLAIKFPTNYKQYSGYITVDESHGRALFYWLVESQSNPKTDPLVVWFQGGPGCSSLLAALTENGPFTPQLDSPLMAENLMSWNRISNLLFVDAPAGVGFSYSNTTSDYNTNNNKTAEDNHTFLQLFVQQYPQYQKNQLWITGESYAGDYVPQLVKLIIDDGGVLSQMLSGMMIGNPVFSCPEWKKPWVSNTIEIQLFYFHAMISYSSYTTWMAECSSETSPLDKCNSFYNEIQASIGNYNQDNMYTNFCTGNATLGVVDGTPNCTTIEDRRNYWINRPDVQSALHARPTHWEECTNINYTSSWPNMLPFYQYFFNKAPQMRILIYSGDVDIATCPHAYSQLCLAGLNQKLTSPWRPWNLAVSGINQTAGYVEEYSTYTFATIKGAGHEVPMYQPTAAFALFERFLKGLPI